MPAPAGAGPWRSCERMTGAVPSLHAALPAAKQGFNRFGGPLGSSGDGGPELVPTRSRVMEGRTRRLEAAQEKAAINTRCGPLLARNARAWRAGKGFTTRSDHWRRDVCPVVWFVFGRVKQGKSRMEAR